MLSVPATFHHSPATSNLFENPAVMNIHDFTLISNQLCIILSINIDHH